jgi:hypothetical protein
MRAVIILMAFLILGGLFIVSNNDLALKDSGNIGELGERYYDWIGNLFGNGKEFTGYVINSDWLPE